MREWFQPNRSLTAGFGSFHQSEPSTLPSAGSRALLHVVKLIFLALMKRVLPSATPTAMLSSRLRKVETPPSPPQLTSGRSSLGLSLPLNVPWRKRPSIQLAQRSPAILSFSFQ